MQSCATTASHGQNIWAGFSPLVIVLNRSCPAVSQICSFTSLLSTIIFLILKSILRTMCAGNAAMMCSLDLLSEQSAGVVTQGQSLTRW